MPFPEIANDFKLAVEALTAKNRKNMLDDYNHELSGVDVGRQKKFFHHENSTTKQEKRDKTKEFIRQVSALQALLDSDPEYAKLYNDFKDLLFRAETATENLIERLRIEQAQTQQVIDDILSKASQLPDGTRVFKHDDGQVYDEHEQIVEPEKAEAIVWKEDSPAYRKYINPVHESRERDQRIENALHYQVDVLGNAREEIENEDNPAAKERVFELQESLIKHSDPAIREEIAPDEHASNHDNNFSNVPIKPAL